MFILECWYPLMGEWFLFLSTRDEAEAYRGMDQWIKSEKGRRTWRVRRAGGSL